MLDFWTNTHRFRKLSFEEVKNLESGDKTVICTLWDPPKKAQFDDVTVVTPLQLTHSADESIWMIETDKGIIEFKDQFYEVIKL